MNCHFGLCAPKNIHSVTILLTSWLRRSQNQGVKRAILQSYLVHLFLDLGVLSAPPVASAAVNILVAVLVHLIVDIVTLVVSACLVLNVVRRNYNLFNMYSLGRQGCGKVL